jgi:hypothetical protein
MLKIKPVTQALNNDSSKQTKNIAANFFYYCFMIECSEAVHVRHIMFCEKYKPKKKKLA